MAKGKPQIAVLDAAGRVVGTYPSVERARKHVPIGGTMQPVTALTYVATPPKPESES